MKILVISDLHLEFQQPWEMEPDLPEFDVAVFAGDIDSPPKKALAWLNNQPTLEGKEIVYLCGNHEFYNQVIEQRLPEAKALAKELGIHFLDADVVPVIDGVRFIGATLWTDYYLFGNIIGSMQEARRGLNDHRLIGTLATDPNKPKIFRPEDALARHRKERRWLDEQLSIPFDGHTVVVTHHCPHPKSVHPRFERDPVSPGFASDLSDLIERHQPTLWVHGHTHDSHDYTVGATRILCNPKGYGPPQLGMPPENKDFDPRLVVELPAYAPKPQP